jgi:hypothetical protein
MRRAGAPVGGGSRPLLLRAEAESYKSFARRPKCGELLLVAENGVFGGLGHAELDHALRRDLDGFTGLGVAAHACFAIGQYELADARDHEYILRFSVGQGGKIVQQLDGRFLGQACLLSHVIGDLRLRH